MASINANVRRLFIATADFISGSIRGQLGFDKTLKRMNMHNNTDDTIVMEWDDNSNQVLLNDTKTITGDKTFDGSVTFNGAVNGLDDDFVTIATTQTITGAKTISESPRIVTDKALLLETASNETSIGFSSDHLNITTGVTKTVLVGNNVNEVYVTPTAIALNASTEVISSGRNGNTVQSGEGNVVISGQTGVDIDSVNGPVDVLASGGDLVLGSDNDVNVNSDQSIELDATGPIGLTSPDSVNVNFDVNSNAVLQITNFDDTNASTTNGLEIIGSLTKNITDGGQQLEAFKIIVEKDGQWGVDPQNSKTQIQFIDNGVNDSSSISHGHDTYVATGADLTIQSDTVAIDTASSIGEFNVSQDGLKIIHIDENQKFNLGGNDGSSVYITVDAVTTLSLQAATDGIHVPMRFRNGVLVSTILEGDVEFTNNVFYVSPYNNARAFLMANFLRISTANVAYTNDTAAQNWFSTNGSIALEGNRTYYFEGTLNLDRGGNNAIVALGFGGTATLTNISYYSLNIRGAVNVVTTLLNKLRINTASLTNTQVVGDEDNTIQISGYLRVDAAGSLIPQFQFSANPGAGVVAANSYFRISPIGSGSIDVVGPWS